jgi:hypothetical protein
LSSGLLTQVCDKNSQPGGSRVVDDARYWRGQAAHCLEIAKQLSDRHGADQMRSTAAEYFSRATELEKPAHVAELRPGHKPAGKA